MKLDDLDRLFEICNRRRVFDFEGGGVRFRMTPSPKVPVEGGDTEPSDEELSKALMNVEPPEVET